MGDVVDIHTLELRDAVNKGSVMVLTPGVGKAGGPPIAIQFIPQTSFGLSGPGTTLYWVYRTAEAQWGQSNRYQYSDRGYCGSLD